MKPILTIHGVAVYWDGTHITYTGPMAVDGDGAKSSHGDPDYQRTTSLELNGKYLDADTVPFIAVPPVLIRAVPGIVLGSQAEVSYRGKTVGAVVGDVGPGVTMATAKLGEASIACAKALGIAASPVNGGVEEHEVSYRITPGVPAVVDGVKYFLAPY